MAHVQRLQEMQKTRAGLSENENNLRHLVQSNMCQALTTRVAPAAPFKTSNQVGGFEGRGKLSHSGVESLH